MSDITFFLSLSFSFYLKKPKNSNFPISIKSRPNALWAKMAGVTEAYIPSASVSLCVHMGGCRRGGGGGGGGGCPSECAHKCPYVPCLCAILH